MDAKTLPSGEVIWFALGREVRRRISGSVLSGGDIDAIVRRHCPDMRESRSGILRRFLREERSKPWGGVMGR